MEGSWWEEGITYQQQPWRHWQRRCEQRRCGRAGHPGSNRRERSGCWGSVWRSSVYVSSYPFREINLLATHGGDEVGHGGAARCVTTSKETSDIGCVGDTLDSNTRCTTLAAGDLVEEQGPNSLGVANVTLLSGSPGVDHADGAAGGTVSELVVSAAAVLALRNGVGLEGETAWNLRHRKGLSIGSRRWGCESTAEDGEGEERELHGGY